MKYDGIRHAITQDNGDLVATLAPCITTAEAFKLADILSDASELDLDDFRELERTNEALEEENESLHMNIDELHSQLETLRLRLAAALDEIRELEREQKPAPILDLPTCTPDRAD